MPFQPGKSSGRRPGARHSCAVSHQLFTEQGLTFPQTEAPPTCGPLCWPARDRKALSGRQGASRRPHQTGTAPRASSARPLALGRGRGQRTSSGDLRGMRPWWDTG